MTYQLLKGNSLELLPTLAENSVDAIVTDPPYELGFMGKKWDASGIAYNVELWRECLRVLKPGGHLLAFGGTRTYHRMAVAIEDAGFEIRDSIHWLYSSGFPKSLDVSKAIDKAAGVEREVVGTKKTNVGMQGGNFSAGSKTAEVSVTAPATDDAKKWEGWGTGLKPAHEPIVLARKPLQGTVANNVLEHGTGALNIDGARVDMGDEYDPTKIQRQQNSSGAIKGAFGAASLIGKEIPKYNARGRWPANVVISEQIAEQNPEWSNYFYCPKPSKRERNAGLETQNIHPTVKPLALMRYLIRLITPPDGTVLDPFAGSGTTMAAAIQENKNAIGIELTEDYWPIIEARCEWAKENPEQPTKPAQPTPTDYQPELPL